MNAGFSVSLIVAAAALPLGTGTGLATSPPDRVPAHPEGTLESPLSTISAGARLPLHGKEFAPSDPLRLALWSALEEYALREVTPDTAGVFDIELEIPAAVEPGPYELVAIASDDEVSARLDLVVTAAAPMGAMMGEDGHAGMGEATLPEARADELPIERPRGGVEWGLIGLLVGLAGGLGVRLLRTA